MAMNGLSWFLIVFLVSLSLLSMKSQAQWVVTNGPPVGGVTCLAASNMNLFAGSSGEGVFLTTDNGTS